MQNHAYDMIYIYSLSCFILIQCSIQQDHPIVRRPLSFLIPVQSCRGASWSWCCAKRTSCILAKKDLAVPVWIDKVFVHPANMTSTELGIRLSEAWRGIGFPLFFSYWVECVQKAGVSKQCSCSASRDVTRITPQALALNWNFYSDSSRVQYCIMFRDDLLSYLDIVGSYLQQSHHLFKIIMISVTFHPLPVHLVSPPNKQIQLALAREVSQHLFGEKTWLSYWPSSEASKLRSESLVAPQLVVVPWQLVRVTAEWWRWLTPRIASQKLQDECGWTRDNISITLN